MMVKTTSARAIVVALLTTLGVVCAGLPVGGQGRDPNLQGLPGTIVYIRDGNVFLVTPTGAVSRQITGDGGYRSPSIADDGTIGAIHTKDGRTRFVLLRPTGGEIRSFRPDHDEVQPPLQAQLSPDGRTFAFIYRTELIEFRCMSSATATRICFRMAFTPSDRWAPKAEFGSGQVTDSNNNYVAWMSTERVIVTSPKWFVGFVRGKGWDQTDYLYHDPDFAFEFNRTDMTADGFRVAMARRINKVGPNGGDVYSPWEAVTYRRTGPGAYALEYSARLKGDPKGTAISPDGRAYVFADDNGLLMTAAGVKGGQILQIDPMGRDPEWGRYTAGKSGGVAPPVGPPPATTPSQGSAQGDARAQIKTRLQQAGLQVLEVEFQPARGQNPPTWIAATQAEYSQPTGERMLGQAFKIWAALHEVVGREDPKTVLLSGQLWTKYLMLLGTSISDLSMFSSGLQTAPDDADKRRLLERFLSVVMFRVYDTQKQQFVDEKDFMSKNLGGG